MTRSAEVDIPGWLRQLMAEVGPRWAATGNVGENIELMTAEFAKVLALAPKDDVLVQCNVAYGEHPRQQLDVYRPAQAGDGRAPIVVFVHGGAFVEGDRNRNAEVYANVSYYLARHGIVSLNIEYRLAEPGSIYPAGSVDVGLAVAWARAHAGEIGGDADRVFVFGHSAGGAHAAGYAYDTNLHPPQGSGVRGVILVSARVRADNQPVNPNARKVEFYYGTSDPAVLDACSALSFVNADSPPTFIAYAEFENPLIDKHCLELAWRIARLRNQSPRMVYLRGHNHTSSITHINTSEDFLGGEIRAFIRDSQ